MTAVRCFVFDLDGTLADTREANFRAYEAVLRRLGFPISRLEYDEYFGLGVADMLRRHAANHGAVATDELVRECSRLKGEEYRRHLNLVQPIEPAISILRSVKSTHLTALATTARRQNGRAVLERLGIGNFFDTEVYGEDVMRTKPAPDVYEQVAEKLGVRPEECAVFEDSDAGVAAALAFGGRVMQVIA